MTSGDRGQIYTLEGLIAAGILIGLLIFILQSVSVVTPQTEMTLDMKLQQKSSDILICIDRLDEKNTSELKNCVLEWEGGQTRYLANPLPANLSGEDDPGIARLNESIDGYLPSDVAYNVDFYFYDNYNNPKGYRTMNIIKHGDPGDNSVKVRKLVTINKDDDIPGNSFWSDSRNNRYPEIVEVQLTAWYL